MCISLRTLIILLAVLRIHLILMRIRIQFTEFFLTKNNFKIFCFICFFFRIFLSQNFMNHEIFIFSLFFKSSDFGFRSKKVFFFTVLVDILPLGSRSVDPDLDPTHCLFGWFQFSESVSNLICVFMDFCSFI